MDKKLLQKKLMDIYAKEYEVSEYALPSITSIEYSKLLDQATDLLETCIREGVRDD